MASNWIQGGALGIDMFSFHCSDGVFHTYEGSFLPQKSFEGYLPQNVLAIHTAKGQSWREAGRPAAEIKTPAAFWL